MPQYPTAPPPGFQRTLWKYRVRLESTFGLALMEWWEKALIYTICLFITSLFWLSVLHYYPAHLNYLSRRFSYYAFDDETVDAGLLLRNWMRQQIGEVWGGTKGLVGMKSVRAEL